MGEKIRKPYYITTAIAYASGKPHIGNTYEIILADAIARFKREENFDVYFQTGTDEHGQKIEGKAKDAGMTPQAYVDQVSAEIKRIWDLMNTSYDRFMRTSRCRRFSKSFTSRAISTRVPTRVSTARPARASGPSRS